MSSVSVSTPRTSISLDRLGVLVAGLVAFGLFNPLVLFRANRIVPGVAKTVLEALPGPVGLMVAALLAVAGAAALIRAKAGLRLAIGLGALLVVAVAVGGAANTLTPPDDTVSRISPAAGFWLLVLAFGLLATDSVSRLRLPPLGRVGLLIVVAAAVGLILYSGLWSNLSVLREYANRADSFWRELATHVGLAAGSLAAAVAVGLPLGIAVHPRRRVRSWVSRGLTVVQTIPSIALFGLLIAPLAWVAANVPGAAALGIAGIGTAPALLALFVYSLMPVVSNTLVGLDGVPAASYEAARGMGMTNLQRLRQVQLPLAFPSILTAIRVVLVQNIGLATIAALIGGGGLGVFVFQGVGQTAMDLVLLGAVPAVALAFSAAVVLDAAVELVSRKDRK